MTIATQIGVSVAILCLVISIGIGIVTMGTRFFSDVTESVTVPIAAVHDVDAFYMQLYEKPIPLASVWKWVNDVGGDVSKATLQLPTGVSGDYEMVDAYELLEQYLSHKCTMSYMVGSDGLYTLEVTILP